MNKLYELKKHCNVKHSISKYKIQENNIIALLTKNLLGIHTKNMSWYAITA